MTALTKVYLKSFILFFFPFAILMAVWEYIENNQINLIALVLQSFIFAALMTWASVTGQKRALQILGTQVYLPQGRQRIAVAIFESQKSTIAFFRSNLAP